MGSKKLSVDEHIRAKRRHMVSELRLRGLKLFEIQEFLAKQNMVNPENKKPWAYSTIHRDLEIIESEWRKDNMVHAEAMVAKEIAKLDSLERVAWKEKNYPLVRQIIETRGRIEGVFDKDNKLTINYSEEALEAILESASPEVKNIIIEQVRNRMMNRKPAEQGYNAPTPNYIQ